MNVKRVVIMVVANFLLFSFVEAASNQWLHVRVQDGEKESVKINVPLALLETLLPLVEEEHLSEGRVKLDSHELTVPEIRAIWESLKAGGDSELVTVDDGDDHVRVSLEGSTLLIRSVEGSTTDVSIEVPGTVVDALLSADGDELNIKAAVQAIAEHGEGELVRVKDDNTMVRIWIDTTNTVAE